MVVVDECLFEVVAADSTFFTLSGYHFVILLNCDAISVTQFPFTGFVFPAVHTMSAFVTKSLSTLDAGSPVKCFCHDDI